ncbi:SRPBCC family protein [Ketobacter sp.]
MSTTNSVHLHRVFKAPPERVYRAFIDPAAMVKWLPPYGFSATMHSFDARVGGGYHMSFTNFSRDKSHSFKVKYLELTPGRCIRHTDQIDDPSMPEQMQVTVLLKEVACGTDVSITQELIPQAIPVEFCYLGWQESLNQLANLVDPDIPDQ